MLAVTVTVRLLISDAASAAMISGLTPGVEMKLMLFPSLHVQTAGRVQRQGGRCRLVKLNRDGHRGAIIQDDFTYLTRECQAIILSSSSDPSCCNPALHASHNGIQLSSDELEVTPALMRSRSWICHWFLSFRGRVYTA